MIVLSVSGDEPEGAFQQIKLMSLRFPGTEKLGLAVIHEDGKTATLITLGDDHLYEPSEQCLAALREFGTVEVMDEPPDFATG